jgi:DNA-binding NarL/FixJ family response regulator
MAGQTYLDPSVAGKVVTRATAGRVGAPADLLARLTAREGAILRLLARGHTSAEIAATLHLSEGRVRNQVSSILAKLDVPDRTQAVVLALQYGLGE